MKDNIPFKNQVLRISRKVGNLAFVTFFASLHERDTKNSSLITKESYKQCKQ